MDAHEYLTIQGEVRMSHAEVRLSAGRRDEARTALERARTVAARKGSTVLVARADELIRELEA